MTIENDPTPQSPLTHAEGQEQIPANVPHSGIHHDEKPFRPDDNTSLQELHDLNLLPTPDHPGALVKKRNKLIAVIAAGGAVLAAGGFLATQAGGKDKPKTVATASSSAEPTAEPSAETPTLQSPAEGPREYRDGIPVLQLKDITPTFGNETSAETLMTNFLANYQNYVSMMPPKNLENATRVVETIFSPDSPEINKAVGIKLDLYSWLRNHPTDAKFHTWQLEKVVNGSLDHHTDDSWIITADILIGNSTEIEHHSGAFRFQKVEVPFADQPIWTLEIEYPKNAYTTPR